MFLADVGHYNKNYCFVKLMYLIQTMLKWEEMENTMIY